MAVGVLPSSAFPAIFPRVYGERCCPRSRLPLIGPRGLRCGGISVELVRKVGGGKSRRVEKFAFYALSVTCDCNHALRPRTSVRIRKRAVASALESPSYSGI